MPLLKQICRVTSSSQYSQWLIITRLAESVM